MNAKWAKPNQTKDTTHTSKARNGVLCSMGKTTQRRKESGEMETGFVWGRVEIELNALGMFDGICDG